MKKYLLALFASIFLGCGMFTYASRPAPSFTNDYAKSLLNPSTDTTDSSSGVWALQIDPKKKLSENIKVLFYPSGAANGGVLWNYVRTIGVAIFFVFLFMIGAQFLMNGDDEGKVGEAKQHFMRLLYGEFLYFGAVRILGMALSVTTP